MGIFDSLFGKKGPVADPLERIEVAPGLELPRGIAEFWPQIESSRIPSIRISASPIGHQSPIRSSFGCYPTIPKGFPYPRDKHGNCLYPLAQICCADLPPLDGYPDSGYLQFYVGVEDTDIYGLDFDDRFSLDGSRVLYFTEEEVREPETDFGFLAGIIGSDWSPVHKPHSLTFSLQEDYLGAEEVGFAENGGFIDELNKKHPDHVEEFDVEIYERFRNTGHKIGGYAHFTQTDPRQNRKEIRDFLLLFQMDTDDNIMWGDAGVGNFFIGREALLKKDFSHVLYNWDCC